MSCLIMEDQEPRAETYATVGASYEVAVKWKVVSTPPDGIEALSFRFEIWNQSTGEKIFDAPSLEEYQRIPSVGEGYWTWAVGRYVQPNATIRVRATAKGYRWVSGVGWTYVQDIAVFEWYVHPIVGGPSYGRVEFSVVWINELGSSVPIDNALCKLNTRYQAWTNRYGKALIEGVTPGSYSVVISKEGYKDYTGSIYVGSGQYVTISAILVKEGEPGESQANIYSNTPIMMIFDLTEMTNSVISLVLGVMMISALFSVVGRMA